ncbi:hypothetical protein H9J55_004315 [Escherichia coli]|nr:hypothetical protein [Escherichia coli]
MKKTLIALAVAASAAVSGSAMAGLGNFDAGNLNNKVDFGGTITPDVIQNNWVWAVGQGYDQFSHTTLELTDFGKKLTITAGENMPLLVGKTTAAFEGSPGISPQIAFSDSKGVINPVWADDNAAGTMTLTVNDAQQQEIGSMTLNVKAFAPVAWSKTNATEGVSLRYMNNSTGSFTGSTGVFQSTPDFATVNAILNAFGAPTLQELQAQIKSYPGLADIANNESNRVITSSDDYSAAGWAYAGAYALGIPTGNQLVIDFNSAVLAETQWNAPLMMQVSYN